MNALAEFKDRLEQTRKEILGQWYLPGPDPWKDLPPDFNNSNYRRDGQ